MQNVGRIIIHAFVVDGANHALTRQGKNDNIIKYNS